MERGARKDLLAQMMGLLVFVAGIAALALAFAAAYRLFSSPGLALGHGGAGAAPSAANISSAALVVLAKVGLLFIMTLAGSLIASRGIQLYFASKPSSDS